jgi:hypothetical protein
MASLHVDDALRTKKEQRKEGEGGQRKARRGESIPPRRRKRTFFSFFSFLAVDRSPESGLFG